MGAKVTFNPVDYEIVVTAAPVDGIVSLDFKIDIYSDGKEDWLADVSLTRFQFPIRAVGGDPLPGSKVLDPVFFIAAPWKILPFDADHELVISGNVYREDGAAIARSRVGRTVQVTLATTFSAGSSSTSVPGSADEVWAHAKALTVGKFIALK